MDLTLRRIVALKVSVASGVEGEALARLDHPNVVRVFGEQTISEHKFLAMQFIPGRTLADFLRETPYRCPSDWDSRRVRRWIDDQIPPGEFNAGAEDSGQEHAIRADRYDSLVVNWMKGLVLALKHAHLRGVLHSTSSQAT
jgi:serine/threonine protein kinase